MGGCLERRLAEQHARCGVRITMLVDSVGHGSPDFGTDGMRSSGDRCRGTGRGAGLALFGNLLCCVVGVAALLPGLSRAAAEPVAERPVYHDGDVFEYLDRFETLDCKRWQITGHGRDGSMIST